MDSVAICTSTSVAFSTEEEAIEIKDRIADIEDCTGVILDGASIRIFLEKVAMAFTTVDEAIESLGELVVLAIINERMVDTAAQDARKKAKKRAAVIRAIYNSKEHKILDAIRSVIE